MKTVGKNGYFLWLKGVTQTSKDTITLIKEIKSLMADYKTKLRTNYKFYSQDLLNNLFKHPYTKIDFVINDLGVTRLTAANYLNTLAADGLLQKKEIADRSVSSCKTAYGIFMGRIKFTFSLSIFYILAFLPHQRPLPILSLGLFDDFF